MESGAKRIRWELLALRCRRLEAESWRELIAGFERKLFYYIRRLVSREADAWDVLQQTWMAAYQGIGRLAEGRQLTPWLYSIARNKAIDHRRQRSEETLDASIYEIACSEDEEI